MHEKRAALKQFGDRPSLRSIVTIFLISYLLVWVQYSLTQTPTPPAADALGYVQLADNLTHRGILASSPESEIASPFFPPLYPGLLRAIASLDAKFAEALSCFGSRAYIAGERECSPSFGSAVYVQLGLAASTLTLIWALGFVLFGSSLLGLIALACVWLSGRLSFFSGLFLTENLYVPLFAAASLALVLAVRRKTIGAFLLTGAIFGLAALTRPSAQYAVFAVAFGLALIGAIRLFEAPRKPLLVGAAAVLLGYALMISPWLARNTYEFDKAFLTRGYASFILVERVSYNRMNWSEFATSFVYWLPWPGQQIAEAYFDPASYRRLSSETPDGFYGRGIGADRQELVNSFPEDSDRLAHLLETRIFGDFPKHATVTIAMAYRGIWVVKFWTLIAVPVFLYLLFAALVRRRHWEFAVFSLPAFFMLFFHAFVSVNVHRYNLILMPSFALATGWFVLALVQTRFFQKWLPTARFRPKGG